MAISTPGGPLGIGQANRHSLFVDPSIGCPKRWPIAKGRDSSSCLDYRRRCCELTGDGAVGKGVERWMIPGVVGNNMAVIDDSHCGIRIDSDRSAGDEERGLDVMRSQEVEEPWGVRARAVVKGQVHHWPAVGCRGDTGCTNVKY